MADGEADTVGAADGTAAATETANADKTVTVANAESSFAYFRMDSANTPELAATRMLVANDSANDVMSSSPSLYLPSS